MKIVEDINYSLDDIKDQIRDTYGFEYIESDTDSGYILLSKGLELRLSFDMDQRELSSAKILLPSSVIDVSQGTTADIYSSSIESAVQIVDLINRMLKGEEKDQND